MQQQNIDTKCPNCGNVIQLNEANFCGSCGVDISFVKQQHSNAQMQYNQQMQYQQYQQQMLYQQQQQQQQLQYQQLAKPRKGYLFLGFIKFFLIFGIISCIAIMVIMHFANEYFTHSIEGGIDESLFYNYFVPNNSSTEPEEYFWAGGVSTTEYDKLENGMSYALASSIIGGDGDLVNTGENLQKKTYYTYRWAGETDENLVYFITFVDDEISEITLDYAL